MEHPEEKRSFINFLTICSSITKMPLNFREREQREKEQRERERERERREKESRSLGGGVHGLHGSPGYQRTLPPLLYRPYRPYYEDADDGEPASAPPPSASAPPPAAPAPAPV